MKKMLFAATIAAAALAGCSKDTVNEAQPQAMSFETYVAKAVRSTPVTGTQFADGSKIGVFAYNTNADAWSAANIGTYAAYMTNVELTKASGAWTYSPVKYWVAGKKYTFFGYAPYDASATVANGVLSFTVPTTIADQKDLMYALPLTDKSWDGATESVPAVTFAFHHALSQVKFSLKTAIDYSELYTITLKSITVKDVNSVGSLSLLDGSWSTLGTPASYAAVVNDALVLNHSAYQATQKGTDVLMLLPQTLTNTKVEIVLTVAAKADGDASKNGDQTVTATIASGQWEANKIYNYQVSLDLNTILGLKEMVFGDPTIEDWPASATDVQP